MNPTSGSTARNEGGDMSGDSAAVAARPLVLVP